jgi:hypothetical protein
MRGARIGAPVIPAFTRRACGAFDRFSTSRHRSGHRSRLGSVVRKLEVLVRYLMFSFVQMVPFLVAGAALAVAIMKVQ